jgi:multiple sugar transport system permease protein
MQAPASLPSPVARRRWSRRATGEALEGYLLISPWVLGFLIFTLGPMIASLIFSFTHYSMLSPPRFTGLDNYVRAFSGTDRLFYGSLLRTSQFALFFVPLGVAISLGLAVMLNRHLKGTTLYRTLFFIPTLTPAAAATLLWVWLLNPEVGPVNYALESIGVPGPRWLASQEWALHTVVIISIWGSVGGARMIIFLAGLQGVPQELYESANIDGANAWHRFRHVTLPMISPVLFFNLVLGAIAAFRIFTVAFMATGGGPAYATWFYMLHLYTTAFRSLQMGYASALAWIFFVIVLGFTIIQFRLSRRWVYYSGETSGREGQ